MSMISFRDGIYNMSDEDLTTHVPRVQVTILNVFQINTLKLVYYADDTGIMKESR